jgi:hypothetical protein
MPENHDQEEAKPDHGPSSIETSEGFKKWLEDHLIPSIHSYETNPENVLTENQMLASFEDKI